MAALKPLRWIAGSKLDLAAMPVGVQREVGYALYVAQRGDKHVDAKVLKGFGDAGVVEAIVRHDGDTFRAVYTVRFIGIVYVLHVFQKKSKHGFSTPKKDIDPVRRRLRLAEDEYVQSLRPGARS